MNATDIQKKIASILPRGAESLNDFVKEALFLHLQETSKKIATFEGRYNKNFRDFKREWAKRKNGKKYSYELESDYLDWEALETYKRDLMRVLHSL